MAGNHMKVFQCFVGVQSLRSKMKFSVNFITAAYNLVVLPFTNSPKFPLLKHSGIEVWGAFLILYAHHCSIVGFFVGSVFQYFNLHLCGLCTVY